MSTWYIVPSKIDLMHHGIKGQKWGEKNGPPYPLSGGSFSASERKAKYKKRRRINSIYNKKHIDSELQANKTKLQTLSYDPNRTKNVDMFYASYKYLDNKEYMALLNKPIPKTVYDEKGNEIGTDLMYKYAIKNDIKSNIKVASEDSGAEKFSQLYKKDRDFYNFVKDPNRMQKYFVDDKYKFKGYRETKDVLNKIRSNPDYIPTEKEVQKIYRMFNYVIPYDGGSVDHRGADDVRIQRTKFFNALKESGYGACLDTNDAIYGGFKAESPIIVFDMDQVIPSEVKETNIHDKSIASAATVVRKMLGV